MFSHFSKGFSGRGRNQNMNMGGFESIFEDIFGGGGGGGFGNEKKHRKKGASEYAQDISTQINLTFDEAVKGVKKVTSNITKGNRV